MRFETPPGRQGQVDFAHFRFPWGRRYALLVVLGYSRLLWLHFYPPQDLQTLIRGLESAFPFFGGMPRELLFDQMRSVVVRDRRDDGGRITENADGTSHCPLLNDPLDSLLGGGLVGVLEDVMKHSHNPGFYRNPEHDPDRVEDVVPPSLKGWSSTGRERCSPGIRESAGRCGGRRDGSSTR